MVDVTNPTISVISPSPGSKNNPIDSLIIVSLEDTVGAETGVDAYSVIVTVNGQYAFNNGILQPGFDGYIYEDPDVNNLTFQVRRDAYYSSLESVNISVSARDFSNNPAATRVFSFIAVDDVPPTIENLLPADLTGQVPSNQPITFSIRTTPREVPVNINSLVITLSGVAQDAYGDLILDAYGDPIEVTFIEPDELGVLVFDQREVSFSQDADGLGFSVSLLPTEPYPLASRITVNISVADTIGNAVESITTFTTSDDAAPTLLNPLPAPDSIGNALAAAITFTLADQQGAFPGSGIDKSSIAVTVDGQNAIQIGIGQEGFVVDIDENKAVNGYDVTIVPSALFTPRKTINVNIFASDNNFNALTTNYVFTTEDVFPPEIIFVFPHTGATTNLPQDAALIVDFKSEVAVGELDIASASIFIDGVPAFANNGFLPGFDGLAIATTEQTLTLTVAPETPFSLGQTSVLDAYISDVFGNATTETIGFTITTELALISEASPAPGIYDSTDTSVVFPPVGSFLDVTLTANDMGALIAYTTDGSDPAVDGYGAPLGTTQIYSSAIRLTDTGGIIRFFAFTSTDQERTHDAVYVFSECPEDETWDDFALRDGLEYTNITRLDNTRYADSLLLTATNEKLGTAKYIHDLGRESFVDSLEFTTTGTTRFRVRVADEQEGLIVAPWCNALNNLVSNDLLEVVDGYGPKVTFVGENIQIDGHAQLSALFADEALARINEPLFESFIVRSDMKLTANLDAIVGAKSFIRITDDVFNFEVQQYISKVNTSANSELLGESSLVGEIPILTINDAYAEGYGVLADGYSGFVELIQPPLERLETFDFIVTKKTKIDDAYDLPDNTNDVFEIISSTPSVYNQFVYDGDAYSFDTDAYDGYTYSSALVASVSYRRFLSPVRTSFAIPVLGKSLDSTTATITSENLDAIEDVFKPAETNNVFTTSVFLEPGDYNFRFNVERSDTRLVSNPFSFRTREDLGIVVAGDNLVVDGVSYLIAAATRLITGDYIIEFEKDFPLSTADILVWAITRSGTSIITGVEKIVVDNLSGAALGQDASGTVGNIVIDERQSVAFRYVSSTALKVSVVATFNSFDTTANPLTEELDGTEIEKIFDGDTAIAYENDHLNFHKVTVFPELPLIVDRVRFTTGVTEDAYQRTRLLIDDIPVPLSNYRARKENGDTANYQNNVDVYSSTTDGFVEWTYVQVGENVNRITRDSIGLLTRFDSFSGATRSHSELDIFTIPELPQLIADFFVPLDEPQVVRKNKSDFAIAANNVEVRYGLEQQLANLPQAVTAIRDEGLIGNFLQTNIVTDASSTSVYVEAPHLFDVGEPILTYDGLSILRAKITEIADDASGLITLDGAVHSEGVMTKDYQIVEEENDFVAKIEIPKFDIVFTGPIREIIPSPTSTIVIFQNLLGTDVSGFVGGRFTYPLLRNPAKIIAIQEVQEETGSTLINLIRVTIDQELLVTQPTLGALVEIYNNTELVTDYVISKTDGAAICKNESLLCSGIEVEIAYESELPAFQSPVQMLCFDTFDSTDTVRIEVIPTLQSATLEELSALTIDFFNGVEAEAPDSVTFTVNGNISVSQNIEDAIIVDGYDGYLFNPVLPSTGQVLQFNIPIENFVEDGYTQALLTSIAVEFTGQPRYCIGEIEALVDTTIVNSRCRIVLDEQVLFLSELPVTDVSFSKYEIHIDRGSLIVFFNGTCVLRRPILFSKPKVEFGGVGKVLDDLVTADFQNITIDQFFSVAPARIQKIGRFIEIEGTVVS